MQLPRRVLILAALALAEPAAAARLCHDLKGLYTPCPADAAPARAGPAARKQGTAAPAMNADHVSTGRSAPAEPATRKKDARIVVKARHCHDLKGLYTPCVR